MTQRAKRIAQTLLPLAAAVLLAGALRGFDAFPAAAGGPATVRLDPTTITIDYGDRDAFTIRVLLDELDHHGSVGYDDDDDGALDRFEPSEGLGAFEILLSFDPGVVAVVSSDAGDFFEGSGRSAQCLERTPRRGQYAIGCVTFGAGTGPQGSGLLATITMRPLANGSTLLALASQLSGPFGDSAAVRNSGGAVTVLGAPTDAPPPPPPGEDGDGTGGGPVVIGGGTPGEVDGGSADPSGGPNAGSGPSGDQTLQPLIIGGALALAGAMLLFAGARLGPRRRRL